MYKSQVRILLVEDDEVDRLAIERLFREKSLPFSVVCAGTVAEAKKRIDEGGLDLLLVDHRLPDGNGFEIQEHAGDLLCIFITGDNDQSVAVKAMKRGAVDFIIKDSNMEYLRSLPLSIRASIKRKEDAEARRRAEEELRIAHEELERRVEERTKELSRTNKALKKEILDRKTTETKLRESEERYKVLFEGGSEGIVVTDIDTMKIMYVNKSMCDMLGYAESEMVQMSVPDMHEKKDWETIKGEFEAAVAKKISFFSGMPCQKKDGKIIYTAISTSHVQIDGKTCLLGFFTDITDRILVEQELQKHREHLEELVEKRTAELQIEIKERKRTEEKLAVGREKILVTLRSIAEGVITTDTEGRISLFNDVAEKLTGWTAEEAAGKHITDVFHLVDSECREKTIDPIRGTLTSGEVTSQSGDNSLVGKDGAEILISYSLAPIITGTTKIVGAVLVFHDVTKKRHAAEELQKSNKLESVGLLAGGLAHDFNNILTSIYTNLSLAKANTSPQDKVHEFILQTEKASAKAKGLTDQLLTFSSGGAPVKKAASDFSGFIKDTVSFALSGSSVTCEYKIQNEPWSTEIDEGQISQAINNLVMNAIEAMPESGKLEVGVTNQLLEGDRNIPLREGRYVTISIKDDGEGIPEEHFSKLFDPYFTTKQNRSGLGLATSYSIINNHNGFIDVTSEPGTGSTFKIFLPATEKKSRIKKKKAKRKLIEGGKIMLMDDDDSIRESVGELLRILGYEVELAHDGVEAIELYKAASREENPFDAVIMDLTIVGGMGGKEAMKHLYEFDPDVRAIVSSGYSNDPVMGEYREYHFCGVVAKPYNVEELNATLQKVINNGDE